ncbi:MAG: T9SS type A sorting domain-containing protein [Flavobacteriales bacterium]
MIKKLLSFAAIAALITATAVAQTNPDFELWAPTTVSPSNPVGWETYNGGNFGAPNGTTEETTDPGEGLKSVKMETKTGFAAILGVDTLGGTISLNGDLLNNKFVKGIPYTSQPTSVSFMVKNAPVNADTAVFVVQLMQGGQLLGIAGVNVPDVLPSWTPATLNFTYLLPGAPDTMIILATSSKATIYSTPKKAQPGSTFWLDDIVMNFPVGVKEALFSERVLAYPNPASTSIRFDLNNNKATSINVTDITGKVVKNITVTSNIVDVSVYDLPTGLYIYQVYNNENIVFTDKFTVSK